MSVTTHEVLRLMVEKYRDVGYIGVPIERAEQLLAEWDELTSTVGRLRERLNRSGIDAR